MQIVHWGGGHSSYLLSQLTEGGRLIAFDQDEIAIQNAKEKFSSYGEQFITVKVISVTYLKTTGIRYNRSRRYFI